MKNVLKLEEFGMFIFSFLMFYNLDVSWWWFIILILTPDISMVGYIWGVRIGALIYNLFHHKGIAILLIIIGYYFDEKITMMAGIILFGHSSMDRIFGYGLKYKKGFKFTHLGKIGN